MSYSPSLYYVIFDIETTKIFRVMRDGYWQDATYKSMPAARAAVRRLKIDLVKYAITDAKTFHNHIEKWETVHSLMSGKPVKQRVNTPLCCDPSSETYWSM
jgi:hypothetical protein